MDVFDLYCYSCIGAAYLVVLLTYFSLSKVSSGYFEQEESGLTFFDIATNLAGNTFKYGYTFCCQEN